MAQNGTVVLGLGNPLLSDEGFGVHMIRHLEQKGLGEKVELLDGGTAGLLLLEVIERARRVLVLDAVDLGFSPGTIVELKGDEVPRFGKSKISPHQLGFQEVLALAVLRETMPEEVVVIGVQPGSLEWGCELTPVVVKQIPKVLQLVAKQLGIWEDRFNESVDG